MTTDLDYAAEAAVSNEEGRKLIVSRWQQLSEPTRRALIASGAYTERGRRVEVEELESVDPVAEVDWLEWHIGVLLRSMRAKIPSRKDNGAEIPREALDPEVINACNTVLFSPTWKDTVFLRFALHGLIAHQEANALTVVGPDRQPSPIGFAVTVVIKAALAMLMPIGAAVGLVDVIEQNTWGAAFAFYLFGIGLYAKSTINKVPDSDDKLTREERAYRSWSSLRLRHNSIPIGSALSRDLEKMADAGVDVPVVAFELCSLLESQTKACPPAAMIAT